MYFALHFDFFREVELGKGSPSTHRHVTDFSASFSLAITSCQNAGADDVRVAARHGRLRPLALPITAGTYAHRSFKRGGKCRRVGEAKCNGDFSYRKVVVREHHAGVIGP